MFTHVPQPLRYAEALLTHFASLSRTGREPALQERFVQAVAELSGCELSQLYLLDATHTSLSLAAEWLGGALQPRAAASVPVDYNGEQLLQFALCQNRSVSLADLPASLLDTSFLPVLHSPWQSLLCVPLLNPHQAIAGLLLCASRTSVDLGGFAQSLGQLGAFVLVQMELLQRLHQPEVAPAPLPATRAGATDYGLIGNSAAMRQAYQLISKVLHSPYTVLLLGETGTGKEVVARAIHDYGPRGTRPFVVQNCAALPENLLESELFGYRRGAFTGALRDRPGLFYAAHGGTLLLDEIGDMPLSLQAKLLRVLQEGEIRPLGSNDTHTIDVRIIAATHRDLAVLVSEGRFREDLYYRLAQFPIELPALRQRGGDVPVLARHFSAKACEFLGRKPLQWSPAALAYLDGLAWPGNVRELKGLVERAVLLCDGECLLPEHVAPASEVPSGDSGLNLRDRLENVERHWLLDCLRKNAGNQTLAARELGLPRRTLLYRLGRLNINLGEFEG